MARNQLVIHELWIFSHLDVMINKYAKMIFKMYLVINLSVGQINF